MLSLKESILSSNKADIISTIKDIMLCYATQKGADELNRLWEKLKVGLDGFEWIPNGSHMYTYIQKEKKNSNLSPRERSIAWAGTMYTSDIIIDTKRPEVGFTRKESDEYSKKLIDVLGLKTESNPVKSNRSMHYLNFK